VIERSYQAIFHHEDASFATAGYDTGRQYLVAQLSKPKGEKFPYFIIFTTGGSMYFAGIGNQDYANPHVSLAVVEKWEFIEGRGLDRITYKVIKELHVTRGGVRTRFDDKAESSSPRAIKKLWAEALKQLDLSDRPIEYNPYYLTAKDAKSKVSKAKKVKKDALELARYQLTEAGIKDNVLEEYCFVLFGEPCRVAFYIKALDTGRFSVSASLSVRLGRASFYGGDPGLVKARDSFPTIKAAKAWAHEVRSRKCDLGPPDAL